MVANNSLGAVAAVVAGGISEMHFGQFPVQDHGLCLFLLRGRIAAKHRFRSYLLRSFSGLVECNLTIRRYGDLALLTTWVMVTLKVGLGTLRPDFEAEADLGVRIIINTAL